MHRLIPIFAALAVLAGPLAVGGAASAKDHDGDGRGRERASDHGDRGGRGSDRGNENRGEDSVPYRNRGGPPPGWREGRGDGERGDRRAYEPDDRGGYAPSPRRGGFMTPEAGGAIPDYGRYRLRPPPRGFVWVRTGNGYAMVSEETGRVFDVVPR